MHMRVFIGLSLIVLTGCHRGATSSAPPSPSENLTGQQRVVGATPILRRNITANDLHNLKVFIQQVQIDTGKYPTKLDDIPGLKRDAANLAKLIEDGDLILFGGKNGVLAYSKAGLERRSAVLLVSNVQEMEPDELKRLVQ
jgi:hypothetical protein